MNLQETIYKRQSIRSYNKEALTTEELNNIKTFIENAKELNPSISWTYTIVSKEEIKTILNWKAPYYLLLYSEEKENYKENMGFIFQQVDLYLQSNGIGSCWLGMISPRKKTKIEKKKYVIGIAFGKTDNKIYREKLTEFKRKSMKDITDMPDEKLKAIQYAPSAVNSQPWYITHNSNGTYNIYREKQGFIKRMIVKWNQLDIGIALAHIYIENKDTFKFYQKKDPEKLDKYIYEGTFEI